MNNQAVERKIVVKYLIDHPTYFTLSAPMRLSLIRKVEEGLDLSAAVVHLKALYWIKTGKLG